MNIPTQSEWQTYCEHELAFLKPLLSRRGYTLQETQPHLMGERFLMQAVTTESGRKLILLGATTDGTKVVIKATRDTAGKNELRHERQCRTVLNQLQFAAEVFTIPPEIAWIEEAGYTIAINAFIDQPMAFLERPLAAQFDIALSAFTAQEGAHATTYNHQRLIKSVYHLRTATDYMAQFSTYTSTLTTQVTNTTNTLLTGASDFLQTHSYTIDQYGNFLTHTDFVPHNFRIDDTGTLYLLDYSSLTFGNKYEGWARFLNFMELYNPPLTKHLTQFVKDNRTAEESLSLKLMRIYRLGEIMWYYQTKLAYSDGPLLELNQTRITFWGTILEHVLHDTAVPETTIAAYKTTRDQLRSRDEAERQKDLH